MTRLKERFRGLYWQQMLVTMGTVLLTLALLGASYCALGYNFLRQERIDDMETRARVVARLSAGHLRGDSFADRAELAVLTGFAASVSDMNFLICDTQGRALLTSDETLSGLTVSLPESVMRQTLEKGVGTMRSDLGGSYSGKRLLVGVPITAADGTQAGAVFAVTLANSALDQMWHGFIGLFVMTACLVLMVAFMASSVTAMHQVQPIREMVAATRRYADGDFDVRMRDTDRNDEIGELAVSFNTMAESLQQTERKRREFIANISHELKTPMTTIAGYTDGILDGTIPRESERQYLQIISDESRRLSRLVRRMLDVSQLQAIDPLKSGSRFDVCESMRRVLISMEKKITDRHLDVEADIPDEPILVLGDNDMITQVIYNLLDNAIKFCPVGGSLGLILEQDGQKARLRVRNTGEIIPAEELPLLFDRFHKADKARSADREGWGLGLYIAKTIVGAHGGEIWATSENGVTEFCFTLPVVR